LAAFPPIFIENGILRQMAAGDSVQVKGDLDLGSYSVVTTTTDGSILLVPNGTGALQVGAGGGTRGSNAVDLQMSRAETSQVASGTGSIVAGANNVAAGNYSVALGYTNSAAGLCSVALGETCVVGADAEAGFAAGRSCAVTGSHSVAVGYQAVADHPHQIAFAGGYFEDPGDAQISTLVAKVATSDATETDLNLATASDRMTLADKDCWFFEIHVTGVQSDLSHALAMKFEGLVKRDGSTTSIVGGVLKTIISRTDSAWDARVVADDTNDALVVKVTGKAATAIRWVSRVHLTEVSAP